MADADTPARAVPLCVDLDGTLLRTDMLHEALCAIAKKSPFALAGLPRVLLGGKARLKHVVAERYDFDPALLPYRREVVDLIESARAQGRRVILTTASPARIAQTIADETGLFDEVLCSDEAVNLSASRKAEVLVERFGEGGFDYIGNHADDLPVLARARKGYLVADGRRLENRARKLGGDLTRLEGSSGGVSAWVRAIRVHQWLKNGLIFVPVLAAREAFDLQTLSAAALAFIAFSLCASAVYIANDLLDLPADRGHRSKCRRPFAAGELSIRSGVFAVALLLLGSLSVAILLPPLFLLVLAGYAVATTSYSFLLKQQVIVDVMLLAGLYTTRILAGSAATAIVPSFWLLAFSMFVFLSLAMVKRFSELRLALEKEEVLIGRGYASPDLPVVLALGSGSGLVSVLVLALYTQSEIVQQQFEAQHWLWIIPPLMLYWISRVWLKASRGEVDDDPVVFAAKDWQSLTILGIIAIAFLLGASGWTFG